MFLLTGLPLGLAGPVKGTDANLARPRGPAGRHQSAARLGVLWELRGSRSVEQFPRKAKFKAVSSVIGLGGQRPLSAYCNAPAWGALLRFSRILKKGRLD